VLLTLSLTAIGRQVDINLEEVNARLDSARILEDDLKIKTAFHYYKSLEKPIDSLLKLYDQSSEILRVNGLVKSKLGRPDLAYASFKKALVLDSMNLQNQIDYIVFTVNTAKTFANKDRQYKSLQWLQNAFHVCAAGLKKYPGSTKLHELAGDIYASTNDLENCLYHYNLAYKYQQTPDLALKLYRLYAINMDYENEIKMVGILNGKYNTFAEFYATQAQLGMDELAWEFISEQRYLPGIKSTLMKAIELKSKNPQTYLNYFEILKMGFAIDNSQVVDLEEIQKVLQIAQKRFIEMDGSQVEILIEGASTLSDMGFQEEACGIYKKAKKIKGNIYNQWFKNLCK